MSHTKYQKKKIAVEVGHVARNGFQIDTTQDTAALEKEKYNWDDLTKLKDELGSSILEFVGQVQQIITNKEIINNLGVKKDHFQRLVQVFFSDVNEFSGRFAEIRKEHDGKSGHVNTLTEFNQYNRLAIQYHGLFSELTTLIAPTMSELVLTIAEVAEGNEVTSGEVQETEKKEV